MGNFVGQKLGHYRIVEKVGGGGMGEVYRARDERLGRDVAIKVLPEKYADNPELLERLQREARVVAALDHPNVVAVHGLGIHGGKPCLVMDLIKGRTVREAVDVGALTNRQVIDIGSQIASGLAAAHDAGVIHFGLDPTNVIITDEGDAKLCGIGPSEPPVLSEYLSPEHIRDGSGDQRSDIFALGVLLYEMLTGLSPFRRVTPEDSEAAILAEDPPLASQTTARVTPAFDGVIRRCMHKRPEDRFQSAHSVRSAIQALVTVPAGPVRARRMPRGVSIVLAAIPAIVIAVVAFGLLHMGYRAMLDRGPASRKAAVRVAVIPFGTVSGSGFSETSQRVSDDVSSRLAEATGLVVVNPDVGEGGVDLETALVSGQLKGAEFYLRGFVMQAVDEHGNERIRVSSQLFKSDRTTVVSDRSFDHQMDDMENLSAEIAEHVVTEIRALTSEDANPPG